MRRILVSALILTTALPALATAQSKKELAAQDQALSARIDVLESRMLTGDPAAERLMQRMDALESALRTATGEVERLRFERDTLRAEVSALSEDIRLLEELATRTRIHLDAVDLVASEQGRQAQFTVPPTAINDGSQLAGESTQLSGVPGAPVLKEVTIPVQEEYAQLSELPATGKRKLSEGDFAGAQSDFRTYLAALPDAPDAGEINYWLGETYYVRGGYADAADAYISSMRTAPNGVKAPEAMIRLAGALRELGKTAEACTTLDSFPTQYPNASADVREKVRTELARTGC